MPTLCNLRRVEDEIHFLVVCPAFQHLHVQLTDYIPTGNYADQFVSLFNCDVAINAHNVMVGSYIY